MEHLANYREIIKEDLDKGNCLVCGEHFLDLVVHHIDGNNTNYKVENLLAVCKKCHSLIHTGIKYGEEGLFLSNLIRYRKLLLVSRFKYGDRKIKERIDYELIVGNRSNNFFVYNNRCYFCGKRSSLKHFSNKVLIKFGTDDLIRKHSLALCTYCIKKENFPPRNSIYSEISWK